MLKAEGKFMRNNNQKKDSDFDVNEPQEEKPKAGMSEEQKRLYEGMQNILNHANRHGGGNK